MSDRIPIFFAGGTGFLLRDIINGVPTLSIDIGGTIRWGSSVILQGLGIDKYAIVPGLNGRTVKFAMSGDAEDPFMSLLDPNVWDVTNINYPASMLGGNGQVGMGASITIGYNAMQTAILANVRPGQPFALAGSSQGAAVCSSCYLAGLQPGTTGPLESYRSGFLGFVGFGNPRRQRNYVAPYGVWSGSWDQAGSNTGGGGVFPATGDFRRLTNCETDKWCEFANPNDIYSSTSATGTGALWTQALDVFLNLNKSEIITYLTNGTALETVGAAFTAFGVMGQDILMVDALNRPFSMPGNGHASYSLLPPANSDGTYNATSVVDGGKTYLKASTDTCLQLGLKFLEAKARDYARSPSVLPPTPTTPSTAGWTTTLIPPAA